MKRKWQQKWHHIMITIKLKTQTEKIVNMILVIKILEMTYGKYSTNSIYY